jgi:hypothetical protein
VSPPPINSGVSSVLNSAHFVAEVETELKIRVFILRSDVDTRYVREEEIVEAIGEGSLPKIRIFLVSSNQIDPRRPVGRAGPD